MNFRNNKPNAISLYEEGAILPLNSSAVFHNLSSRVCSFVFDFRVVMMLYGSLYF